MFRLLDLLVAGLVAFVAGAVVKRLLFAPRRLPPIARRDHPVVIHDDETDDDYTYYENESRGDDPTQPGRLGQSRFSMGIDGVALMRDSADGRWFENVSLDRIECGRVYYIQRYRITPAQDQSCGGPDVIRAEFEQTKDEVLRMAVRVADRCKRHPSCQADIVFRFSQRQCLQQPAPPHFNLYTVFQVDVVCYTL